MSPRKAVTDRLNGKTDGWLSHLTAGLFFFMPWLAGKPFLVGVTDILPILSPVLFGILGAAVVLPHCRKGRYLPSLLFVSAALASAASSLSLFQSRNAIIIIIAVLAAWHMFICLLEKEENRFLFLEALGYSAAFLSIYAIAFAFSLQSFGGLYATFYNYNAFAGYLALATTALPALLLNRSERGRGTGLFFPLLGLIAVYLTWCNSLSYQDMSAWTALFLAVGLIGWIFLRRLENYKLWLLFSLPTLTALFLTGSRAGIMSGIVAIAVFAWLQRKHLRPYSAWLAAGALLMLSALTLLLIREPFLRQRLSLLFDPGNRSNLYRLLVWRTSWNAITASPLFGHGPGSFASLYPLYKPGGSDTLMAHNSYLQLLAELGLAGLATLSFFLLSALKGWRKKIRFDCSAVNAAALAGLLSLALHNIFDYTAYIPAISIAAMLLIALLGSGSKEEQAISGTEKTLGTCFRILVVLSAAWFIASVAPAAVSHDAGRKAAGAGWTATAESRLQTAVNLDPLSARYRLSLAEHYQRQYATGRRPVASRRAEELLRQAVRLEPRNPQLILRLAAYLLEQGYLQQSIELSQKAAALDAHSRPAWRLLGQALLRSGDRKAAARAFEQLLRLRDNPYEDDRYLPLGEILPSLDEGLAHLALAGLKEEAGQHEAGAQHLRQAADIFSRYISRLEEDELLAGRRHEIEHVKSLLKQSRAAAAAIQLRKDEE